MTERTLAELRGGGFTRISFGMQSAVPHVLAVLDRAHQPGRPEQCVAWARAAGFEHVSLDLIYGTPGETRRTTGRESVRSRSGRGPRPHLRLRADRRGGHPAGRPDQARRAGRRPTTTRWPTATWPPTSCSSAAGLRWYEISNWAAGDAAPAGTTCCTGPAATGGGSARARTATSAAPGGGTSGIRPRTRRGSPPGASPGQAREVLTAARARTERIMLADPARVRAARSPSSTRPGGRGGRPRWPTAWPTRQRSPPAGSC